LSLSESLSLGARDVHDQENGELALPPRISVRKSRSAGADPSSSMPPDVVAGDIEAMLGKLHAMDP